MKPRRLRNPARGLTWIALAGTLAACSAEVLPPPPPKGSPPPAVPAGIAELAARLRPSVVHISAHKAEGPRRSGRKPGGLATDLREFFDRFSGAGVSWIPKKVRGTKNFGVTGREPDS